MKYNFFKISRIYNGRPYCGPASDNFPAGAEGKMEAYELYLYLLQNPVGWNIFEADTGLDVTQEVINDCDVNYVQKRSFACPQTDCPITWGQDCICQHKFLVEFKKSWNSKNEKYEKENS